MNEVCFCCIMLLLLPHILQGRFEYLPTLDRIWDCELHSVCNNLCLPWLCQCLFDVSKANSSIKETKAGWWDSCREPLRPSGGLDSFHQGQANTVLSLVILYWCHLQTEVWHRKQFLFLHSPFFPIKLHPFQMASFLFSLFRSFSLALIYKAQFT